MFAFRSKFEISMPYYPIAVSRESEIKFNFESTPGCLIKFILQGFIQKCKNILVYLISIVYLNIV